MERTSKRGKIPQQDWPSIISRYESGETLASIARTYDCSPPAISYIVSRTRARGAAAEGTAPKLDTPASTEPRLVKAPAPAIPANHIPDSRMTHSYDSPTEGELRIPPNLQSGAAEHSADAESVSAMGLFSSQPPVPKSAERLDLPGAESLAQPNGLASRDGHPAVDDAAASRTSGFPGGSQQDGEARRTLHLSLPQGNGSAPAAVTHPGPHHAANFANAADDRPASRLPGGQPGFAPQPRQPAVQTAPSGAFPNPPGALRTQVATPDQSPKAREGGAFIDHTLRERIDGDIAVFLAAFDAALDHDTAESRTELREATDRLLRAGARTRIELERLEARLPLPPRDPHQRPAPVFRPR
jgi:transposase-like protein